MPIDINDVLPLADGLIANPWQCMSRQSMRYRSIETASTEQIAVVITM